MQKPLSAELREAHVRSHLPESVGQNSLEVVHCSSCQLVLREQKLVKPKKQWQGPPRQGGDGCAPSFHSKRIWSLSQWDQKTVTSDLDQLQSAKPAEMNNNSDQEQRHRKTGWPFGKKGKFEEKLVLWTEIPQHILTNCSSVVRAGDGGCDMTNEQTKELVIS